MQKWTSVTAILRINQVFTMVDYAQKIDEIFLDTPQGNNGKLTVILIRDDHPEATEKYTLSIVGDLIDYPNDNKSIQTWFLDKCHELETSTPLVIRNGYIHIENNATNDNDIHYIYRK